MNFTPSRSLPFAGREGTDAEDRARLILCSFPEVTQCSSQTGRPDDGTDTTSFFNTEYFVDLKPKDYGGPPFTKIRTRSSQP
jgi:heavy metal efflux system protein